MPTGYTARLYEGEQDFKDFVRQAARGMGAFYHLRDAGAEAPLTYPENDAPRRLEEFKKSRKAHTKWRLSSEEDKYLRWSEYVEEAEKNNAEDDDSEFLARRDRFAAMIAQVESHPVPEELETFKDFMLQQLGTESEYRREPYKREVLGYVEWCQHEEKWRARREELDLDYYRNAADRYAEVTKYIDLLGATFGFEVEKHEA